MKFIDWLFSSYENPTIEGQWGLFHISVMLIIVALVVAITLYFRGESANDVKKKRIVLFVFASLILIFFVIYNFKEFFFTQDFYA